MRYLIFSLAICFSAVSFAQNLTTGEPSQDKSKHPVEWYYRSIRNQYWIGYRYVMDDGTQGIQTVWMGPQSSPEMFKEKMNELRSSVCVVGLDSMTFHDNQLSLANP